MHTRYKDMGDGTHALVSAARIEDGRITLEGSNGVEWPAPHRDDLTGAAVTIEYEHHEIHDGNFFHSWYGQTVSDIGDKTIIAFRTPVAPTRLHLIAHYLCAGAAEASVFEAPTVTNNTGATLTVYNRDRDSLVTSGIWDTSQTPDVQGQATYFTEVTQGNVTGGTEIWHAILALGTDNKPAGGELRGLNEWILKANTLYAFVLESKTDDDNSCMVRLNWYELEE